MSSVLKYIAFWILFNSLVHSVLPRPDAGSSNDTIHVFSNGTTHNSTRSRIEDDKLCNVKPDCDKGSRHRRYIPFSRPRLENITEECKGSSADDFPPFFTKEQNSQGAVILCFLIGLYGFTLLAIVCDDYFLPCVECICESLKLSQDVAAAIFMSIATSCPELFTNLIGTFITESDIGIGTIVGSSLFNALGVASIGGLAAVRAIQLDWWPVTRDVSIYIAAVSLLVVITWDNIVFWYEALILFITYFVYLAVMFQNVRISKCVKRLVAKYITKTTIDNTITHQNGIDNNNFTNDLPAPNGNYKSSNTLDVSVITSDLPPKSASPSLYGSYMEESQRDENIRASMRDLVLEPENTSIFVIPKNSICGKLFFFYTFPLKFALFCTTPNPKKNPKLFPITFVMCILWIGLNSYLISWMISVIGSVFKIPDAVLGLTFLAAGGCLPESISITIMSRRGEGSMGVSNSLGANTMNILLSLGMPWFFKTILKGTNDSSYIVIQSGSIEYTILALVVVAIALYLTLYLNKFRLSKLSGVILMSIYLVCVVLAILSEMVFFKKKHCSA